MKKILLSLFLSVFVSIGAWADDYTLGTDTWCSNQQTTSENVVIITLNTAGKLSDAITAASSTYSGYKQVYIKTAEGVSLNQTDITALQSLNYETIDLQDASYTAAFTFSNANVKNLILPNGFTKEQVNACASPDSAFPELGSAISLASYNGGEIGTALNVYVKTGNTLSEAVNRTFMDNTPTTASLRSGEPMTQYNMQKTKVKSLSISGYPVARDYGGYVDYIYYTEDGHFQFDQEPDENSSTRNYGVNTASTGQTRKLTGPRQDGAMLGASLIELDLENAIISDDYSNDLTLSWIGTVADGPTKYVKIPTCSDLTVLPADFIAGINSISEICIPANIERIKTRAFAASVDHIWTTRGTNDIDNTTWDNGITDGEAEQVLVDGEPLLGYTDVTFGQNRYGTYTFSSNLKVIERFAFANTEPFVSDVYVLSEEAPECHVDAFGSSFYVGYSGYGVAPDASGIITRGSFKNGTRWLTMLHYPRSCTTPQIQRYTDPTREYSIATGLTDGKGAQVYFPMYGEFLMAYLQGTYGYTWRAWSQTRTNYGDIALNPVIPTNEPWKAAYQATANSLFTGEADATFYDTTLGGNVKPAGLSNYYDVIWEGVQLYPQAEQSTTPHFNYVAATETDFENGIAIYTKDGDNYTEATSWTSGTTYYKRVQTQVIENGAPQFVECSTGHYVKDIDYVADPEGTYMQTPDGMETKSTNKPVEGVTTYYANESVTEGTTPKVADGYYFEDGVNNIYNQVDFQNDPVGAVDQYYKEENGEKVQTDLHFWNTMYYPTGRQVVKGWVKEQYYVNPSMDHYNLIDGEYVLDPNATYGNEYWVYYTDIIDEYIPSDIYSDRQWYAKDGDTYTLVTINWYSYIRESQGTTLYYVTGTETNYSETNNSDYDASVVYFTDNTASTVADVTFANTYYYQVPKYIYTEAEAGYEGTLYKQVEIYREKEDGETATTYCPVMQDVEFFDIIDYSKDYRGWHQFVLTGYAANTDVPMISYRSYLTDTDWWTICVPFDLNYNEAKLLFGDPGTNKIPFVSQLLNVIRDESNSMITLNFSENLMTHKAVKDNDGNWVVSESEAPSTAKDAQDEEDIVMHAGVPYLIRPNFVAGRQFDVYPDLTEYPGANISEISAGRIVANNTNYPGLFYKLKNAENASGYLQRNQQRDGIVTVPALVAEGSSEATVDGKTVTYKGTTYPVSAEWDYTFVGAYYNNMMPANCYYLGYNPTQKKAMFYVATEGASSVYSAMKWINNTAVICPNMLSSSSEITRTYNLGKGSHNGEVTPASGQGSTAKPAQWIINSLVLDDLGTASGANGFNMNFNGFMSVNNGSDGIEPMTVKMNVGGKVYTIDGRFVGESTNGLSKGIYIQNGKKVILK